MIYLAEAFRLELIEEMGLREEDVTEQTFKKEAMAFTQRLCRHLGDRYAGDRRVGLALHSWCNLVDDYDAWDVLLSAEYVFEGRESMLRRGRILFPGTLTAHWADGGSFSSSSGWN